MFSGKPLEIPDEPPNVRVQASEASPENKLHRHRDVNSSKVFIQPTSWGPSQPDAAGLNKDPEHSEPRVYIAISKHLTHSNFL